MEMRASQVIKGALGGGAKKKKKIGGEEEKRGKERDTFQSTLVERCGNGDVTVI